VLSLIFLTHLRVLKADTDSPIGFSVGGLGAVGPGPIRIGEVAVEEDYSEDGEDGDEWEEVVHRSLLLFEP
jgi:hypothetical protein